MRHPIKLSLSEKAELLPVSRYFVRHLFSLTSYCSVLRSIRGPSSHPYIHAINFFLILFCQCICLACVTDTSHIVANVLYAFGSSAPATCSIY